MPIKGLTDKQEIQTNRLGKNWVGQKRNGKGIGKDLKDRFRLDVPPPYDTAIQSAYGSLQPKQLRVFFPFDKADQCFEAWNDAYTVQGLKHRCDGDRIRREVVTKTAYRGGKPYQKRCRVDCDRPCEKKPAEVICKNCVSTGYLSFIVRELFPIAGMSQVITQTVTGITNIVGITNQLASFEAKYGSLRESSVPSPSTAGFIPFVLLRVPQEISRPLYDGQKKEYTGGYGRGEAWPIKITEDPEWLKHWGMVQRRMQIAHMIQAGQSHLLMGEDLAIAQQMTQISLPPAIEMPVPAIQQGQPHQKALPEFTSVDTEAIADENAMAETDQDESEAYRQAKLGRESGQRITAVNEKLKLDREEMLALWDGLKGIQDERDRTTAMISAMLIHWAQYARELPLTEQAANQCLERLRVQSPMLVDEDLAAIFAAESEHWLTQGGAKSIPETIDGVSIE